MFGYILTEERTIQPATPGHIDLESFREYLQAMGLDTHGEPQPSDVDDLRNRGVVAELGDTLHPTSTACWHSARNRSVTRKRAIFG